MQAISATDASVKLATLLNQAQREPLMIRRNQQDFAVMLSAAEYQRLSRQAHFPRQLDARMAAMLDGCD